MKHAEDSLSTISQNNTFSSACIMPISVGQKYHTGIKFKNDLDYIAKRDGVVIITLADTLQRHTLGLSMSSADETKTKALLEGDKWLEAEYSTIQEIKDRDIPVYIIRWDEWLNHPSFNDKKVFIDNLYNTDAQFKKAINSSVGDYIRRTSAHKDCDIEKAKELSTRYKLEECAVMLLWAELGIKNLAYPNKLCEGLNNIYRRFANPKNLLTFTNLANRSRAQTVFFNQSSKPIDIHGFAKIACSPIDVIFSASILDKENRIRFLDQMENEIKRYKHEIASNQEYNSRSW